MSTLANTNNNLSTFYFGDNAIRVVVQDEDLWFVLDDICSALNLTNPSVSVKALDEDERSKFNLGRQGETNVVNEYGLYNLILGSRKEEAKQFKRWITHEVIPQIRKTGTYSVIKVEELSPELQMFNKIFQSVAAQQLQMKSLEGTIQNIKETVILTPDNWREDINRMVNKIAMAIGDKKFREVRTESYDLLQKRAGVNLNKRLDNLKIRLMKQGASQTTIGKANKLDVIEADAKLREIYLAIIKEYSIKYVS